MKVYKVVNTLDGRMISCTMGDSMGEWIVDYEIGKVSKPNVERTYLYAFKSKRDAISFMRENGMDGESRYIILKCDGSTVKEKPYIATMGMIAILCGASLLSDFWEDLKETVQSGDCKEAPKGTVWCTSITPLEIML